MSVVVYTKGGCPFCIKAKQLLTSKQIPFREVNLEYREQAEVDALIERTNYRKVPQIFIKDEFIGGYSELQVLSEDGELDDLAPIV